MDTITADGGIVAALETGIVASESEIGIQAPDSTPVPRVTPDVQYTALAHCQVTSGNTTLTGINNCPNNFRN